MGAPCAVPVHNLTISKVDRYKVSDEFVMIPSVNAYGVNSFAA